MTYTNTQCCNCGHPLADNRLMKQAYIANSTASWAKGQLAIIADMLAEEPPTTGRIEYIVDEIRRIADGIELIGGVDQ